MQDYRYIYRSRCKLGPKRCYWVVVELGEPDLIAEGYCPTLEEAEAQAKEAAGEGATDGPTYWARDRHSRKVQAAKRAKGSGATTKTYVYSTWTSDWTNNIEVAEHPVAKMTERRIYVLDGERIFVLDRQEMTREGHAWRRGRRSDGPFFLSREDALGDRRAGRVGPPKEFMDVLGLSWPCSLENLRAAFRMRSKEVHPDHGGEAAEFRKIHAAYSELREYMARCA